MGGEVGGKVGTEMSLLRGRSKAARIILCSN